MHRLLALGVFICLFLLCACQPGLGQTNTAKPSGWLASNPGGGGAFNSPVLGNENYWAIGSDLGGVYISKDQGSSWYVLGAEAGLTATHIASLASHPDGFLLIGTDNGLYRSNSELTEALQVYDLGYVSALVVSANPQVIYASVHPSYDALTPYLIRSSDGGLSWQEIPSDLPTKLRITGMRAHPVDADGVWVISGQGRFNEGPAEAYFSSNGGQNFSRLDPQQGELTDIAYALDPKNPNLIYASSVQEGQAKLFKSLDTGFNWLDLSSGETTPSGIILANASSSAHLWLIDLEQRNGKDSYLWESPDAGSSWTKQLLQVSGGWSGSDEVWGMGYSFQGLGQTIGYNPNSPNTILWSNSQFVYKSSDGGKTWADTVSKLVKGNWRSSGIDNVVPIVVEPSEADPNLVYAGYMDMGLWRSDDGGDSWIDLNTPAYSHNWLGNGGNTLSIVADPTRADVVWAQVAGNLENCLSPCEEPLHLLKSSDRGANWLELKTGLPQPLKRLEGLSLAPDSPTTNRWLYAVANGDVYLSQNDGNSWTQVLDCPNNDCLKTFYTDSGVYALSASGIWRSWQGGVAGSWQELKLPESMTTGWTAGEHWLHNSWTFVGPLDLAARNNEVWLAVKGAGKGLYHSSDAGETWTRLKEDKHARSVELDPVTLELLFASSSALQAGGYEKDSNGVFISQNGQNNWTEHNDGLAYPFATSISISERGARWLISPGQGVMRWQTIN